MDQITEMRQRFDEKLAQIEAAAKVDKDQEAALTKEMQKVHDQKEEESAKLKELEEKYKELEAERDAVTHRTKSRVDELKVGESSLQNSVLD